MHLKVNSTKSETGPLSLDVETWGIGALGNHRVLSAWFRMKRSSTAVLVGLRCDLASRGRRG